MTWSRSLPLLLACAALGCETRGNMADQAKHEPLEANALFRDGRASRPLPEGTVPREPTRASPRPPLTMALLRRGRERFDIHCSPCHGRTGEGRGMIVLRGFPPPPSLHIERIRRAPDRQVFDVITSGFGTMYPYATRVAPEDRWAIVAYVRALQLSRNARLADVPPGVLP